MLSQRASILKKKGANANGEFQNMHLAVYPFEVQFLKDVGNRTAFYFQKKYQVIGKVTQAIPACTKGCKYPLKSLENIINFRLFSQNNVIYQWSAYRVHENGEEQFVDSCAINLKEIVTNYIIPQKSTGSRSLESLINLSFGNHEIKLKFSKIGMILSVNLLISDDPKSFKEVIEKKYCPENQQNLPQVNLLKAQSVSGVIPLSSRRNNSQEDKLGSSIKLLKNQSKRPAEQPYDTMDKVKQSEPLDLDTLILNEGNAQPNIANNKMQQLRQQLEEQQQIQQRISSNHYAIKIEQLPIRQFPNKRLQLQNEISSGILKLQSDQIQKDKMDIKLELQQLEMIEEEIRSNKETINDTISPRFQSKKSTDKNLPGPNTPNKNKLPFKPIRQEEQNQQASMVVQSKFTVKKAIVYFIILFIISIAGATAIKSLNTKKAKSKRK